MNTKCRHCPLLNECPGERNARVCVRADASSNEHSPRLLEKITNFTRAAIQHVAAGAPRVDSGVKAGRLVICQGCEQFEDGKCRLCGCNLEVKAGWADQSCPLDPPKWGPIETSERMPTPR